MLTNCFELFPWAMIHYENYTRILHVVLNKSLRQQLPKQQLYSHLLPISQTILERQASHAGHCWSCKYKLRSNILLWTPTHGHLSFGWPAKTYYIHPLSVDTLYCLKKQMRRVKRILAVEDKMENYCFFKKMITNRIETLRRAGIGQGSHLESIFCW